MNEADKFLQESLAKAQQTRNQKVQSPQHSQTFTSHAKTTQIASKPQYAHKTEQMLSMGEAFWRFLTDWTLEGRSSRAEFWFVVVLHFLICLLMDSICGFLSMSVGVDLGFLQILWGIATLWPWFALTVRRLHDLGGSGVLAGICFPGSIGLYIFSGVGVRNDVILVLILVLLIPSIILFCLMFCLGDPHKNQYGPVPKR
jgi:uncharacterized membrane protein YhaH (DUF805 family)